MRNENPQTAYLQTDLASDGHLKATVVELKQKTKTRNQQQARHRRTITAQAPAPQVDMMMKVPGGDPYAEEDPLTFDANDDRLRPEALNDFFKDADEEIFND